MCIERHYTVSTHHSNLSNYSDKRPQPPKHPPSIGQSPTHKGKHDNHPRDRHSPLWCRFTVVYHRPLVCTLAGCYRRCLSRVYPTRPLCQPPQWPHKSAPHRIPVWNNSDSVKAPHFKMTVRKLCMEMPFFRAVRWPQPAPTSHESDRFNDVDGTQTIWCQLDHFVPSFGSVPVASGDTWSGLVFFLTGHR